MEALRVGGGHQLRLPWQGRTGPDQGHLAANDVEQLRQLVDAEPAQETTRRRDAGIILELVQTLTPAGGRVSLGQQLADVLAVNVGRTAVVHRPEFVEHEWTAVPAQPGLRKQRRSRGCQPHQHRDHQQQRRQQNQAQHSHTEVEQTLPGLRPAGSVPGWLVGARMRRSAQPLAENHRDLTSAAGRTGSLNR